MAFAIVGASEDTEGWEWFLNHLKEALPILTLPAPPGGDWLLNVEEKNVNETSPGVGHFDDEREIEIETDTNGEPEIPGDEEQTEQPKFEEDGQEFPEAGFTIPEVDCPINDTLMELQGSAGETAAAEESTYVYPYDYFRFISDRQKGLIKALATVFPRNHASYCAVHIARNVQAKFGKEASEEVLNLAKTFSLTKAEAIVDELPVKVREYLEGIEDSTWRNTAWIEDPELPIRYGITSSNISEAANSMFDTARDGPWLYCVDTILAIMADRISFMRTEHKKNVSGAVTEVRSYMETLWKKTSEFRINVIEEDSHVFRVTLRHSEAPTSKNMSMVEGRRYNVDIRQQWCDCGWWQATGIPCVHALTYYKRSNRSLNYVLNELISPFHTFDAEHAMLKRNLTTVCVRQLLRDGCTNPPIWNEEKKTAGRPKKQVRLRQRSSYAKGKSPISCKICGGRGHNSRTCHRRNEKTTNEGTPVKAEGHLTTDGIGDAGYVQNSNETLQESMSQMDLL